MHLERCCQSAEHVDGNVTSLALQRAEVSHVDASLVGQLLLRQAPDLSKPTHIRPYDSPPSHCEMGPPGGSIGPGSIQPIDLGGGVATIHWLAPPWSAGSLAPHGRVAGVDWA